MKVIRLIHFGFPTKLGGQEVCLMHGALCSIIKEFRQVHCKTCLSTHLEILQLQFEMVRDLYWSSVNNFVQMSRSTTEPTKWRVPSEDSEQPRSDQSLRRALIVKLSTQGFFMWTANTLIRLGECQTDPSLRWAHSHFVGFLMLRLKYWTLSWVHFLSDAIQCTEDSVTFYSPINERYSSRIKNKVDAFTLHTPLRDNDGLSGLRWRLLLLHYRLRTSGDSPGVWLLAQSTWHLGHFTSQNLSNVFARTLSKHILAVYDAVDRGLWSDQNQNCYWWHVKMTIIHQDQDRGD